MYTSLLERIFFRMDEEEDMIYGDRRGDELPPEYNTKEKMNIRNEKKL